MRAILSLPWWLSRAYNKKLPTASLLAPVLIHRTFVRLITVLARASHSWLFLARQLKSKYVYIQDVVEFFYVEKNYRICVSGACGGASFK